MENVRNKEKRKSGQLAVRKFTIRIRKAAEGGYVGQYQEPLGAISEAETLVELKSNMAEAIRLVLDEFEARAKNDKKIIIEIPG